MFRSERLLVFVLVLSTAFLWSCDRSEIPFLWKKFKHPIFPVSLKVPRSWEIKKDGLMGADVVFLAPEKDAAFRANVNLVIQDSAGTPLKELARLSAVQLSMMMKNYTLRARAETKLGEGIPAELLRGVFETHGGDRVIWTIVAVHRGKELILTMACRLDQEDRYQMTFHRIRESVSWQETEN